ncbi:uncharacterized protein [Onthophagus taurus]|uniref:uncharacterized protein isoform X1 n=1 Tax=Onthophagus taurus TaxID=166361 RepID=UPI000C20BBBF|nr:uncharacterized protein LOC111428497 isoform X1 [Onthophagus taurus]
MRSLALIACLWALFVVSLPTVGQRLVNPKKYHNGEEEDLSGYEDYEDDANSTEKGTFVGAPCDETCYSKLQHVFCNQITKLCECEKKYPVKLNPYTGCSKPTKLGEQCYYKESCRFADQYSSCVQVHHNAICQCRNGYHSVSIQKPSKRVFCAEDAVVMTTNFSTFAGVLSGIALLSGLICFVLKLFNQNLYTGRHRYGNANLPPPILFSSEAGLLPMALIDRQMTSSISSQRTFGSTSVQSRRASSALQNRGAPIMASSTIAPSRTGSRRPSIASVHSTNSIRSYSMRRYEKEREQKEEREMQKRLARMQSLTNSTSRIPPTPSPHSTDDLLPTLEEDKQVPLAISEESSNSFQEDIPSTSKQYP